MGIIIWQNNPSKLYFFHMYNRIFNPQRFITKDVLDISLVNLSINLIAAKTDHLYVSVLYPVIPSQSAKFLCAIIPSSSSNSVLHSSRPQLILMSCFPPSLFCRLIPFACGFQKNDIQDGDQRKKSYYVRIKEYNSNCHKNSIVSRDY